MHAHAKKKFGLKFLRVLYVLSSKVCISEERKGNERTILIGLSDYSPARETEPAANILINGEDEDGR
jgi:hypothetical protein